LNVEEPAFSIIGLLFSSVTRGSSCWRFQGDKLSNTRKKLLRVVRYAEKRSMINVKGPIRVEVKVPNEAENAFPNRVYAFRRDGG
jgi:hypothetical protein